MVTKGEKDGRIEILKKLNKLPSKAVCKRKADTVRERTNK